MTVGDFNGDGIDDLAVANSLSNTVGALSGNGSGGFAAVRIFSSGGSFPNAMTASDFNGDGIDDIAVANSWSNNVSILIGDVDGGVMPSVTVASGGAYPRSLTVGDFNGDRIKDLVVTNELSNNFGVLINPEINQSIYRLDSVNDFQWILQRRGVGTGQLLQGSSNAFDGLNRLKVAGSDFVPPANQPNSIVDGGRTLVTASAELGGLIVNREITVPDSGTADFARTTDVFTNPTAGVITLPVRIVGNLGSDSATVVFATSDGDNVVEPSDTWFGTDDADGTGTPAIIHLLRSADGIQPTNVQVIEDNVVWDYLLTVPAGQTVRLAHFTILTTSRADSITSVNSLVSTNGFSGQAGTFLDPAELASLANFIFVRDYGDAPLPYPGSASHLPTGPTLGATRDTETGVQRSSNADGDGSDEDGVTIAPMQVGELGVPITVTVAGGSTLLDAWIDFNRDGDWDDAGEQAFVSLPVVAGDNHLLINVPASAVAGETFARFRISTAGGLTSGNAAVDGEVEDYKLTLLPDTIPTTTLASNVVSPTRDASFDVLITFDEILTGLALNSNLAQGDIRISPAATTTATLAQVDSKTYRLTVIPTTDGPVTVNVVGDAAFDGAGNGNAASSTFTALIDRTPPTPVITPLQASPSHLIPLRFSVDFGEGVSGFSPSDLLITNGTASNFTSSDNRVYSFNVNPIPGSVVSFNVPAGAVNDAAGNTSVAASPLSFQTIILDFGDAPASYPTLLANDGATHVVSGPRLGSKVDFEQNGQPSIAANGDGDDEDGVTFGLIKVGQAIASANVNLQNATSARVDAWIDFNANGSWEASERILSNSRVYAGSQSLNFVVPQTAIVGETYARVRVSSAGGLLPTGQASDGEVEDYRVLITEDATISLPQGNSNDVTLRSTGTRIEVRDNLNAGALIGSVAIASTRSLTVQGGQLNDKVRVDFASGGFFSLPEGVKLLDPNGTDQLLIQGTGSTLATYQSRESSLGDASIIVRQGTAQSLIDFSGFEPLDITGMQTFSADGTLNIGPQTLTIQSTLRSSLPQLTTIEGGPFAQTRDLHLVRVGASWVMASLMRHLLGKTARRCCSLETCRLGGAMRQTDLITEVK